MSMNGERSAKFKFIHVPKHAYIPIDFRIAAAPASQI